MSPEFPDDLRKPPQRPREKVSRSAGPTLIILGIFGLVTHRPLWEWDIDVRGWRGLLGVVTLTVWVGFIVIGTYRSVRSLRDRRRS